MVQFVSRHDWGFIETSSGTAAGRNPVGYRPYLTHLLDLMNNCPEKQVGNLIFSVLQIDFFIKISLDYDSTDQQQQAAVPLLELKQLLTCLHEKKPERSIDYEVEILQDFIETEEGPSSI